MPTPVTRQRFWFLTALGLLTLLALAAVSALPVLAQTDRYVDAAGLCAGNPNCTTTIGAAVAASGPGDTIYVFPGTYAESVNLSRMATPGDITFIAVDTLGTPTPGTVTVDPGAPGGPGWGSAFRNSAWPFPGRVTINGFIVKSPTADGIFLHAHGDANGYTNRHAIGNARILTDTDANVNGYAHANADQHRHAHSDADVYAHRDANSDTCWLSPLPATCAEVVKEQHETSHLSRVGGFLFLRVLYIMCMCWSHSGQGS